MMINRDHIILILLSLFLPIIIFAQTIESDNYKIEVGRVSSGIISILNAVSENYQVDILNPEIEGEEEEEEIIGGGGGAVRRPVSKPLSVVERPSYSIPEEVVVVPVIPPVIPPVIFPIIPPKIPPTEEILEGLPEQLFDINLEIDNSSIESVKELISRVIFTSFGTVPTPVDLTFTILDESGNIVYTKKDYLVVETEAVFTKKFEDIELSPDKYTLVLNTLYNIDVEDEFRQNFEIIEIEEKTNIWIYLGSFAIVLFLLVLSLIILKKKKEKWKN